MRVATEALQWVRIDRPSSQCSSATSYGQDQLTGTTGALVPGGQQVYIERDTGAVKYTQAHSADTFGGVTGGWKLEQLAEYGKLTHRGGLYACSTSGEDAGPWKVYVKLSGVELPSDCLGFWGLASNETKPDAWQYT